MKTTKIISAFSFILLLFVACKNSPQKDNNPKKNNQNIITFKEFEKLAKNEDKIPLAYIKEFVKFSNITLIENHSVFISKGVVLKKKFKLFLLKQGGKNEENYILITYDNILNKQIDIKNFLTFSRNDIEYKVISDVSFMSNSKNNEFVVNYFISKNSKAMPDIENISIISKENWKVDKNGFFIKI